MNHVITCKGGEQIYVHNEKDLELVKNAIEVMYITWLSVPALITLCNSFGAECRIYYNGRRPKPVPRVELAAIKSAVDGWVHSVPQPGRHHDVIATMVIKGYSTPIKGIQGFILNDGTFVDRIEARKVAEAANQLLPRARESNKLYSEDVWEGQLNWKPIY